MSAANVNISIDNDIKRQAQALFSEFGIDLNTAINIFLRQAVREQAIPFSIEMVPQSQPIDDEKFFSGANLKHLKHSLAQAESGKVLQHDLINADA